MPIKQIKKSKDFKDSEKKVVKKESKDNIKIGEGKETRKVVVRRRKTELRPTKASAVAIVSQANRAKKQALIEKLSNTEAPARDVKSSDTRIPLWVWVFFGCSLFLFCISFYKAIICPQLAKSTDNFDMQEIMNLEQNEEQVSVAMNENYKIDDNLGETGQDYFQDEMLVPSTPETLRDPETATEVIEEYFSRLSNHEFDKAFDLMIPVLRKSSEIREHFSSFRMDPFLDGIEGGRLIPSNFEYVNSPAYGRDVYKFDLSYVMISDQSRYDEIWEFSINTSGNEPKISSVRCVTTKCSRHPIFWPENFGLMK